MHAPRRKSANATLADVAGLAGYSVSAVSKALLGGGGQTTKISAEAEARIRAAAEELGYRLNSAARQLKTGKSRMVGALIHGDAPKVLYDLFARLQRRLAGMGYCFLVAQSEGGIELLERNLNEFRSRNADAIISAFHEYPGATCLKEMYAAFKNVLYLGQPDIKGAPYVESDIRDGVRQLVDHLVRSGSRRIVLDVTTRYYRSVRERIEGYREGLAKNSIAFDEDRLADYNGDLSGVDTVVEKAILLKADAIIAGNDIRALRIIKQLNCMNIKVPEKMSVTGFDNLEFASSVSPSLTTVDQCNEKIADAVTSMLKVFLKTGKFPASVIVKPELVIGESA